MLRLPFTNDKSLASTRPWLLGCAASMLLTTLVACGGGSSGSMATSGPTAQSCTSSTCGSAVLSLTDAAGAFLSYKITLVSLQLKDANGALVETLPVTTKIDFAQLVNLSEIVSAKQIPLASYVAAQVTVDFTGASILVDDGTGTGIAVTPIDSAGKTLGQVQLTVQLDAKNDLKINAGKASRIAFDFNLLASNTVDLVKKTVTVSPVLVASVVPTDHKVIRVRGAFVSADTVNKTYTVQIEPFHEQSGDKLSPLLVHTTDATTFEINGTPYTGAAGLTQLATLAANALTVAFGTVQAADQSFLANRVLAGTSVADTNLDHISGNVIARSGNVLTVHGAQMDGHDGSDEFVPGDSTVTIAAATAVTTEGQASATPVHSIAEISVGSRVEVFGTASKDTAGKLSVDATAGRVRLDFTQVQGVLNVLGTGEVTLNLSEIDRQPVTLFNFAGTGLSPAPDSDPSKYRVSTGNLDLSGFPGGTSVLNIGFVAPFGAAPPDFNAVTLANSVISVGEDHDSAEMNEAELVIDWGDAGTTVPFKMIDAMHLDLDITNANIGQRHRIEVQPTAIDLKTLAADPSIVPVATGNTLYAIGHRVTHSIDNFNGFADFEAKLATALNGTVTALGLSADGQYDSKSNTFTAQHIVVLLND